MLFCWTSQLWRATLSPCSSRGRNTAKMQTSSFPSPSSAASGPWQIPSSGLGEWNVPYWGLQSVCSLLISSSNLLYHTFILTVLIYSHPSEQETGPLPLQLVEAFGLVIQCRDSVGKHSLLTQTIHTLKQAVQPGKPLHSSCLQFSTQDYIEVQKHSVGPKMYFFCITSTILWRFFGFPAHCSCTEFTSGGQPWGRKNNPRLFYGQSKGQNTGSGCEDINSVDWTTVS